MAKYITSFSRIAIVDSEGVCIAYVRIESDNTVKIVRDVDKATKWVVGDAMKQCNQMNEWSHCVLEYKVIDFEVVQIERQIKYDRRNKDEEIALEE